MERIINDALLKYLLANSHMTKHQHGFIRRRSTATTGHYWTLNLQARGITDVIYFDFNEASVSQIKLMTYSS